MAPAPPIAQVILTLRHQKVILDADLAAIYEVPTKRLNEQVKRNSARFPADFLFQLNEDEMIALPTSRAQTTPLNAESSGSAGKPPNRSQIATGSQRHRDPRFLPYAFTEHGAIMAATVLNSPAAIKMSVFVVRAFILQRELILAHADVLKRLAQIDASLLHHDEALRHIWRELQPLLAPPPVEPKPQIGFHP